MTRRMFFTALSGLLGGALPAPKPQPVPKPEPVQPIAAPGIRIVMHKVDPDPNIIRISSLPVVPSEFVINVDGDRDEELVLLAVPRSET